MPRKRKNYTANEKVSILRRHFVDKVSVSDLCDELGLQPTVFYRWQKTFFENGASAFQSTNGRTKNRADREVAVLEVKLQKKNEVLAELMEEHVALKKNLGVI